MLRVVTYLLLVIQSIGCIIPFSDTTQLVKIPDLIEHYDIHKEEAQSQNTELGILTFLFIHLVDADNHSHEDNDLHQDLPFQNFTINVFILSDLSSTDLITSDGSYRQEIRFSQDLYAQKENKDFFHPPRFA